MHHTLIAENDKFIALIELARQDSETGKTIKKIVTLDGDKRKELINNLVNRMKQNKEAEDMIEAIDSLFNYEIAAQVLKTISK